MPEMLDMCTNTSNAYECILSNELIQKGGAFLTAENVTS